MINNKIFLDKFPINFPLKFLFDVVKTWYKNSKNNLHHIILNALDQALIKRFFQSLSALFFEIFFLDHDERTTFINKNNTF